MCAAEIRKSPSCGGWIEDPALEQLALEGGEGALLDDLDRLPVVRRGGRGEPELEQRAGAAPAGLEARLARDLDETLGEAAPACVELVVEARRGP